MKRTGCSLLVVCACSVLAIGRASATRDHDFSPKCLSEPWNMCVPGNIKVRCTFYQDTTCICITCLTGPPKGYYEDAVCASLSRYGPFPAAQWVALRSIAVGNLSSQTLGPIHPSSLKVLVLIAVGTSTIKSNTFARFPHLRSVHLDYNTLSQLKRAYFSGWNTSHDSTVYLSVSYNRIAELEPGCFENIPYLTRLDLSHNLLTEVASGWFRGLSFLHTLILSHNKIEVISTNALNSLYDLRVLNISHNPLTCLSERTLSRLSLKTFSVGRAEKCLFSQDTADKASSTTSTNAESSSLITHNAAEYFGKTTNDTRLTTLIEQDPYKTLIPLVQSSTTSSIAKGTVSRYLLLLAALPGLIVIVVPVMVYKNKSKRTAAQNAPNTLQLTQSGITLGVTSNTKCKGPAQKPPNSPDGSNSSGETYLHTYAVVKDDSVYDPSRDHSYYEIRDDEIGISVQDTRAENDELNHAAQNVPVAAAQVHCSHQVIDVTQLISNPMYPIAKSNQALAQPWDGAELTEHSLRRLSCNLPTSCTYSDIKDEDVYDPTRTHLRRDQGRRCCHDISVKVARV
ncbi:LRIG2 [Branchiostoma lanceolatum]|uniref:LRIG2 protein n=1 Tax=Branchiostoma lanceolatum TaxID=7740 RepID=A0A8J9ZIJ0_BRALA|nr:LRIG2 [Branchiostoma lanceolatum]